MIHIGHRMVLDYFTFSKIVFLARYRRYTIPLEVKGAATKILKSSLETTFSSLELVTDGQSEL